MASSAVRKSAAASSSSSSSLRFLGVLKQPVPSPNPTTHLEFDESDVFWSPTTAAVDVSASNNPFSGGPNSPLSSSSSSLSSYASEAAMYSPSGGSHRSRRPFGPERSGLSAALAEDPAPLLKTRRSAVDLYLSAARAVPAAQGGAADERLVLSGSGKLVHMSAPVNVPVWPRKPQRRGVRGWGFDDDEDDEPNEEREGRRKVQEEEEDEAEEENGEIVPPHIIVARSHVTTFSVFEGVGRTLKGRDLRRVRNAVLQKTGFLD